MSTWTNIVWRQAARALLNGTDNCNIPHNTLDLNCDNDNDMENVVNMMSQVNISANRRRINKFSCLEFVSQSRTEIFGISRFSANFGPTAIHSRRERNENCNSSGNY